MRWLRVCLACAETAAARIRPTFPRPDPNLAALAPAVQRSSAAIKEMQSEVHQALQWVEQNQQGAQAAAMGAAQAY